MNITLAFLRVLFFILSLFFITTYMISGPEGYSSTNLLIGLLGGSILGCALIGFDILFRRFNLRSFNIAVLGLFFGYLMGLALVLILKAILDISAASIHLHATTLETIQITLFLFGIYIGTLLTMRAADELYISIPFVRLATVGQKKRDIVLDISVLSDARIIDLATSGLLDQHLIIPRFLVKDLHTAAEVGDEMARNKAKRALDVLKKLEAVPELELRYNETDFHDIKDPLAKMVRFARLLDANILTADISRIQTASIEGVRFINIHALSNALKPLMQTGEQIRIKIQRYGKEPRQGVGYLDDGTMVVVNGGGAFLGEIVDAQVLSVKHTTSGRMIFCNVLDGEEHTFYDDEEDEDERR
jgi:uncharacterized protein YacL